MTASELDGIRTLTTDLEREIYSQDQVELPPELRGLLVRKPPERVVQPRSEPEVARVLRYAEARDLPVVPRGAASSPYGGAIPAEGGVVLDLSLLRTVLAFDPDDGVVSVEAGVRWADLDQFLEGNGYALRSHPTSWWSTVAGWLATGGYGLFSLGFGPFASQVEWIRVVDFHSLHTVRRYDPEFRYYVHTEGQMGVVTQLGIRARPRPAVQRPLLFTFPTPAEALRAAEEIAALYRPVHMTYYDPVRVGELNRLQEREVLEEAHSLLVVVEDEAQEAGVAGVGGAQAERYRASFLWEHRFFPMKVKKLGPGILGAEFLAPLEAIPRYLARAEQLADRFDAHLAHETHLTRPDEGLLITSFLTDQRDLERYLPHLLLTLHLMKAGIRAGGRAYGIGLWNRPFLSTRYPRRERAAFRRYKRSVDPKGLLNPGKGFHPTDPPFPPSWLLRPGLLNPFLARVAARLLPPLYDLLARLPGSPVERPARRPVPAEARPSEEDLRAAAECAHCGACITVCPAYLADKTELVTARGKLMAMEKMARGEELAEEEAFGLFDCIHCSACTNVCQSAIDLVPVWDRLEALVARQRGKPVKRIEGFVRRVEAEDEYHDLIRRGLAYPIQTPKGGPK